jgi:hypothetical protein
LSLSSLLPMEQRTLPAFDLTITIWSLDDIEEEWKSLTTCGKGFEDFMMRDGGMGSHYAMAKSK